MYIARLLPGPLNFKEILARRWLRCTVLQLVVASSVLVFASVIPCIRQGLLRSLFALSSPRVWSLYLLFCFSQLLVLALFWLVTEPERTPGVVLPDLTKHCLATLWRLVIGGGKGDVAQTKAGLIAAGLWSTSRRGLFATALPVASILAAAPVNSLLAGGHKPSWAELGLQGVILGVLCAGHYLINGYWVLSFPAIERRTFFQIKLGVGPASSLALLLAAAGTLIQEALSLWLPLTGPRLARMALSFMALSICAFCFAFGQHAFEVFLTERHTFSTEPRASSSPSDSSPSLLSVLEAASPAPSLLILYLAYLDLCHIAERNTERWRRANLFEETGEVYRRVITRSLAPLDELTLRLKECIDGGPSSKSRDVTGVQMLPPEIRKGQSALQAAAARLFADYQLCAWGARAASALTAASRREDTYGVAQRNRCHAQVVTSLLSCLLAVEAYLGRKPTSSGGAAKWLYANGGGQGVLTARPSAVPEQPLAMADVLRSSVYGITRAFGDEMLVPLSGGVVGLADKDWLGSEKLVFGSRDQLVQKLLAFLDYRE